MEEEEALGLLNSVWVKAPNAIQGVINTSLNPTKTAFATDTDVGIRYILNDVIFNDGGIMRLRITYF